MEWALKILLMETAMKESIKKVNLMEEVGMSGIKAVIMKDNLTWV